MKCSKRIAAAISLLFIETVSAICLNYLHRDDSYYIVCGAFNCLHVYILWLIGESLIIKDIMMLSILSFIIQIFGFTSYHFGINIKIYNYSIHVIVFLQFLRLFIYRKGDPSGVGTIYTRIADFLRHDFGRNKINFESKK